MASSLLQRLVRRRSPVATVINSLLIKNTARYQTLAASPLLASHAKSIDSRLASLLSPPPQRFNDESVQSDKKYDYLYPSFSYGVVLNPIFKTEVEDGVEDGVEKDVEMWADSTKKKRKKKMNKHKYRKMRRKLRHKG